MGKLKKKFPVALIIAPYVFLVAFYIAFIISLSNLDNMLMYACYIIIPAALLLLLLSVLIPNAVYVCIKSKKTDTENLLFWNMLIKLFHIPAYITVFITAVILTISVYLSLFAIALAIWDIVLLISTAFYGISGLRSARQNNTISKKTAIPLGIMHFIFCLDVIAAVLSYVTVKKYIK